MHRHLFRISLVTATLFLSVTSTLQLPRTGLNSGGAALAQTTQDRAAQTARLIELGNYQFDRGQFREALETFQQVLDIARAIGSRRGEGTTLNKIGLIYKSLGQYSQALKLYEQALAIQKQVGDKKGEGIVLSNLGVVYSELAQYSQALKCYEYALVIHKQVGNKAAEGIVLGRMGNVYSELRQYSQALKVYEYALVIQKQVGNKVLEGATLDNIGQVYKSLKQYSQALKFFTQALAIHQQVGNKAAQGPTLAYIGLVYSDLGQYPQALKFFSQALAIAKQVGNKEGEGSTLGSIGVVYNKLGQYPQALKFLEQALAIHKQVGNKEGEGTTLGNIAQVYSDLKQYPQALKFFSNALIIAKQVGNKAQEGAALKKIGIVYKTLGQYTQAKKFLEQYLAIAKKVGDKEEEGATLHNIGVLYYNQGQYPQALKFYEQALVIHKQVGNKALEGTALDSIGSVYLSLGQYAQALKYLEQALAIVGEKAGEGPILNSIGNVYSSMGKYPQALNFYEQALAIRKQVGDKAGEGIILGNMGKVYEGLRQYTQALKVYQNSLAIAKQVGNKAGEGSILSNIGLVYDILGQYAQALKFHEYALVLAKQVGDKDLEGATLTNIGFVYYRLGQYDNAEKSLVAAILVLEFLRSGLREADKISMFDKRASSYPILQQSLVAQNKTNTALEISERGRARAFVELLASRLSTNKGNNQLTIKPPNIAQIKQIAKLQNSTLVQYAIIDERFKSQGKEQWRESELFIWVVKPTGEVAFRRSNLKPLWQKQNTTLKDLAPNSSSVAPVVPNLPSIAQTTPVVGQEVIIPNRNLYAIAILFLSLGCLIAIAICYKRSRLSTKHRWLFPSLLFVCATTSTGGLFFLMTRTTALAQNPSSRDGSLFAQLVDDTRESIETSNRGLGFVFKGQKSQGSDRLKQLHEILIQPIDDLLPKEPNAHVIFIPQSSLFLVPFPALQDKTGKYLIEKHTILTAPSIQVLQLTRQQKQRVGKIHTSPLQGKEALIVGNPTMPKVAPIIGQPEQQLPSLPGAEAEARAIASMLKTQAITGSIATKPAILQKMSDARIIHLATHGLFDDVRGLDSAIALAPSDGDNGLLSAEQILDLKLNAELVVLSACDTGRGKITGDGVVGLSRSLITAGVPSVVVSLWSVPDAPTADLMSEFYRNFQQNSDKAAALRGAMLTTMKQHPNPRDWAAFTLIGESH